MRFLNTLYVVDHGSRVRVSKGALTVTKTDGQRSRVPLNAIDGVVLAGYAQISTEALSECVYRQIRVAALRRSGRLRFCVGGPTSGNVHLRLAQYRAADCPEATLDVSRWLVAGKLQNCRRMMMRWAQDASEVERAVLTRSVCVVEQRIDALGDASDGDTVRGLEGDGTRRYFKGFAAHLSHAHEDLRFTGRSRRPPRDPANALLGFVYGLVLAEVVGALDAVGLDPQVGFLHGVRPGRPSLGLDLLEELRPAVADRFVARTLGRKEVGPEDFVHTPGGACYLTDDGRRALLKRYEKFRSEEVRHLLLDRMVPRASIPLIQAKLFARHLRADLPMYPPYVVVG